MINVRMCSVRAFFVATLCVIGACGGSTPSTGTEGAKCYGNGTCNAGFECLSKLCVSVRPSSAASSVTEQGKPSRAPVAAGPPTTAVILDDYEAAAVLACSISGKLVGSAWTCSQEMKGDLAVTSLDGRQRKLGAPKTLKCDPTETGDVQAKRAGFRIDKSTSAADDKLLGQFLIWPASRARDAILWNTRPTVDIVGLTRRAAEISSSLTYRENDGDVPYVLSGAIEVRGALSADIDGDDKPDVIYSIALPSDMEPFWQPRYLIASVSSRPGELLEVGASTYSEIQAVAAIDLDGDGADEVLVTEPYHEGSSSFVGRFKDGKIDSLGGWGCGL